jgi:hypothetical protein
LQSAVPAGSVTRVGAVGWFGLSGIVGISQFIPGRLLVKRGRWTHTRRTRKPSATKNPESLTLSGFLAKHCCYLQGVWWRRRESNPRPEALYDQFYILSSVI